MENQHRQIKGYRELSQVEIDLMNRIKSMGIELGKLIDDVSEHHARQANACIGDDGELARFAAAEPGRWRNIARTDLQQGLMALTRSVAQPGFF